MAKEPERGNRGLTDRQKIDEAKKIAPTPSPTPTPSESDDKKK